LCLPPPPTHLPNMSGVIDSIERAQMRRVPVFQAGDRLRVHFQVVEGTRRRTQVFEGVVIKRQGTGARETFTVRKQSFGVGVERTFPLHSPKIEKIDVAARGDVRRAKLYYLRDRVGRGARVRERRWTGEAAVVEAGAMPPDDALRPGEDELAEHAGAEAQLPPVADADPEVQTPPVGDADAEAQGLHQDDARAEALEPTVGGPGAEGHPLPVDDGAEAPEGDETPAAAREVAEQGSGERPDGETEPTDASQV